jgi:ankyrin repeat protein
MGIGTYMNAHDLRTARKSFMTISNLLIVCFSVTLSAVANKFQDLHTFNWVHLTLARKYNALATSLIQMNPRVIAFQNDDGLTAAHLVAYYGNIDLFNQLKELNARFEIVDKQGRTPLMLAEQHGHCDVAHAINQYLMRTHKRAPYVSRCLCQASEPLNRASEILFDMVMNDDAQEVYKIITQNNIDVNKLYTFQWQSVQKTRSLLHHAVACGALDTVAILLKRNDIDVNIRNPLGVTPLHGLVESVGRGPEQFSNLQEHVDTIEALCRKGALVNAGAYGDNNATPLHYAARLILRPEVGPDQLFAVLYSLFKFKADYYQKDFNNVTPQHLIKRNIAAKMQDSRYDDQEWPLDIADDLVKTVQAFNEIKCLYKNKSTRLALEYLKHQPNVQWWRDRKERNIAHIAAMSGHTASLKYLRSAGAEFYEPDIYGRTAQQIAHEKYRTSLEALLTQVSASKR